MENIKIFDTTLRDGEQSPGASMNTAQKIEIAHALSDLNVDIIEAGFPIASPDDFASVQAIAQEVRNGPVIAALARSNAGDIDRAGEALSAAERKRIHTFIATSPIHREYKLKMTEDEIVARAVEGVRRALSFTDDVEFSPEDAGRTEDDFLARIVEEAIEAGATTINIPDTVGYCKPEQFRAKIAMLMNRVPNIDKATVSAHCHNDLGLAVANSLAGIEAGARQVECTINGIGERAGNAALEEIVMALRVHRETDGFDTNVNSELLVPTSKLVQQATWPVQRNKSIVGQNAFAHEAGIHQHGMLSNRQTYEIVTPESVGWNGSELVLGRHSGIHAVLDRFSFYNLPWRKEDQAKFRERFKIVADAKADNEKYVSDEELLQQVYYPTVIEITGGPLVESIEPTTIPSDDHKEQVRIRINQSSPHATAVTTPTLEGTADDESEGFINAGRNALAEIMHGFDVDDFSSRMVREQGVPAGSGAPAEAEITAKNGRDVTMKGRANNTSDAGLAALQNAFNALFGSEKYAQMVKEASAEES